MLCTLVLPTKRGRSLIKLVLISLSALLSIQTAYATDATPPDATINRPFKFNLQLGVDTWKLNIPERSNTPLKGVDRLYLPDSYTKWNYRSPAEWIKTSGQLSVNSNLALVYKARADQSVGTKLDDLHFDYQLSPKLGFRAGVLDYKTSWCKTYETDSPWIQEIDPFCSNPVTNEATLASPGIQTYLSFAPSHYLIQTLAGVYRPKAFGYNKDEFSNVANTKGVAINHRWGWSINAIDLHSGSELRLSWLGARQENNRDLGGYRGQDASALYVGASFYPTERLNVKASVFNSLVQQASYSSPPRYTQILETDMVRKSQTIELIYKLSAQDSLGVATSKYINNWNLTGMNGYEVYSNPDYYRFTRKGSSATWRHDWERGVHTSIQWMTSENDQLSSNSPANAKGRALGLRIGFTY